MKKMRLLAFVLIFSVVLAGCAGSPVQESSDMGKGEAGAVEEYAQPEEGMAPVSDAVENSTGGMPSGGFVPDVRQKIIFTGDISVETEKFDETMMEIDAKVKETGSYYEGSSISGTGRHDYDLRYASLVIRVPSDKFDYMRKAADDWGTIISSSTSSQDVTKQYVDTEARVRTLKAQEERLLLLLGKAEKLEDIIILEGRLSDVRFEIENYTGTLKALDALVDYATLSVMVREVRSETYVPETFGQKLLEAIKDSLKKLGEAAEGALIALIYMVPYIVIIVILAIVIRKSGLIGRIFKGRARKGDDSERLPK